MTTSQTRHTEKKQHTSKSAVYKEHAGLDKILLISAFIAIFLGLWAIPLVIGKLNLSFLPTSSGIAKFISIVLSVLAGLVIIMPTSFYKNFFALSKGARLEWKKSTKPEKDMVVKTTIAVLALVAILSLFLTVFDSTLLFLFKMILS